MSNLNTSFLLFISIIIDAKFVCLTRRQTNEGSCIKVYIIEEVAHTHAQNASLEWFWSTPGLGVVPRLLREQGSTNSIVPSPGRSEFQKRSCRAT